ncbi:MAG TPA: hypothetical protein VKW06_12125 [Candidatus Angelobacter sp.]|nr:hypothetical protein [Candidatus Angelobacter sp.]
MKSIGGKRPPSPLPLHNALPSPEHVLERIKTITGELGALKAEIYGQITDPAELLDRRTLLEQAGAAGVLMDFKNALDHLRSILWFCESGNLAPAGDNSGRERELARATELLKALLPPETASQKQSGSFFERLDRVIDNYMQEGAPSPKESRRSKN